MLRGKITDSEIGDFERLNKMRLFQSDFEFLMSHNGIRPNMLHGLMGTTGSGKSTLMKSIIAEVASKERVLVWLSEEEVKEYQLGIRRAATLLDLDVPTVLNNLRFVEEKTLDEFYVKTQADLFSMFEDMVVESDANVVFIDNMSTSQFYSDEIKVSGQSRSAVFLSKVTKKLNVSIFYVIHTSKNVFDNMDRLMTKEDVRGSQKLVIMTEYFYILQKFTVNDTVHMILKVDKHRHHNISKKFFLLGFKSGVYRFDKSIGFDKVNEIFIKRDHLGRRKPKGGRNG